MTFISTLLRENLVLQNNLEYILRILVACVCGGLIGLERTKRMKEAGVRTHVIVCCAAALMMIISKYAFADLISGGNYLYGTKGADPSRIASQVVSGISFLGAGVIFKNGNTVKGLTTAAGIWFTAAVGLAIGGKMYVLGIAATVIILGFQYMLHKFTIGESYSPAYSTHNSEEDNMNIKGIIFDLDGVIVFTDKLHYKAWKIIADRLGIYFDEKVNNRLRGVSRMDSLEIILENYSGEPLSRAEKEKYADEKNEYYRELLLQMTPDDVTDEVRKTLRTLKNKGYRLAVGSSSKNAKLILERVRLMDYFDAVSDGTNITRSKPDPEVFLKAASFLNLSPKECAVVEDADAGIEAAKAGGMTAIAIGNAVQSGNIDIKIGKLEALANLL